MLGYVQKEIAREINRRAWRIESSEKRVSESSTAGPSVARVGRG